MGLLSRLPGRGTTKSPDRPFLVLALLPIGLLGCSLYVLTTLLPHGYHASAPLAMLPNGAQPMNTIYGGRLELVGVSLPEGRFERGGAVPLTLYWRTQEEVPVDYRLFIQLLDERHQEIANITTHPGWGRNPTSLWQPELIYPDSYEVTIVGDPGQTSPLLAAVYVGFLDPESGFPLPAQTILGAPAPEVIGYVQVAPSQTLSQEALGLTAADVAFSDAIKLIGYSYPVVAERSQLAADGDKLQLPVRVLWEAEGKPAGQYTAFVHMTAPTQGDSSAGQFVVGLDQPPAGERFPTQYWQAGDRSLSKLDLSLPSDWPSGTYELWMGLYRSESSGQERLAVARSSQAVRDDSVLLGTLELR
jgi:hypothetical protein